MNSLPTPLKYVKVLFVLSTFFFLNTVSSASAQISNAQTVERRPQEVLSDSTDVAKADSIHQEMLNYERLVKETLRKRYDDSVKKQELLQQISLLQERDQLKEQKLLREIAAIEAKDSIRDAERRSKILKMKDANSGFPVAPFSDTLFYVYLKIGPVLPAERAASINRKVNLLYEDDFFRPDSLTYTLNESSADITYGDMIVMSITEWDALLAEKTQEQMAQEYGSKIKVAITREREINSFTNLLIRVGFTILIIIIVGGVILILNRFFRRASLWIIRNKDRLFKGVKIRDYEILPPARELDAVLRLTTALKWAVFLLIMYISLPIIFSFFPFTKGWASMLFSWIWNPARGILISIWHYLPNIFSIAVIYTATHYTIRLFKFLSKEVESGRLRLTGFHADWALPTFNIVKFLLYAFMFVVIFPYLPGSDSPIFRGVSVFLGILFSLGSSTAIANAVSGLVITYMRPYRIGDRVKINDVTGEVVEKSLLVTRVRTIKNEYITVPNASILTGHTINFTTAATTSEGIILHTTVTIGYDVPWRKVHELLIGAATSVDGIMTDKPPFVLQTSLDDYYVSYQLNAFSDRPDRMALIYSQIHQNIQDRFNEAEVEILSPHYRAVRDGNMVTVPMEYLPKDYKAPSFRIGRDTE